MEHIPTITQINFELARMGYDAKIVRDRSGYFYFTGDLFDIVPSIYSNSLKGWTMEEIRNWVTEWVDKHNASLM